MPRRVGGGDLDRVSSRLLGFVFELLAHHGADPRALSSDLATVGNGELPAWVSWSDYITMIHRLGQVAGGAEGVAAGMRAVAKTAAYSELRGMAGFFEGPLAFFAFVTNHLNRELVPGAIGRITPVSNNRVRVRYEIDEALVPSRLYLQGTVTLVELFPTHFGMPEATVEVSSLTDRTCEIEAILPQDKPKVTWGQHLGEPASTSSLTRREQEVLQLVCDGLTNAEIATALGTAASTVKSQISSILAKMDVANRTELAARVSRTS